MYFDTYWQCRLDHQIHSTWIRYLDGSCRINMEDMHKVSELEISMGKANVL